jgi:hypothetical protein
VVAYPCKGGRFTLLADVSVVVAPPVNNGSGERRGGGSARRRKQDVDIAVIAPSVNAGRG